MEEYDLSIIIPVLNSHEVVKRQMLYWNTLDLCCCEIILVDDGSTPPILPYFDSKYELTVIYTNDPRPWSQPCARNRGAEISRSEMLLMTDIDHIISQEQINAGKAFNGDKMIFPRQWAVLDTAGGLHQEKEVLLQYGLDPKLYEQRGLSGGSHANTFCMQKSIFDELGGYDESFCGKYGGDDTDFNDRYGRLHRQGLVARHVVGPRMFVFPDPRRDAQNLFHSLRG